MYLLAPLEECLFINQVKVVHGFENGGSFTDQLIVEFHAHQLLKSSQQVLLGFLVTISEL